MNLKSLFRNKLQVSVIIFCTGIFFLFPFFRYQVGDADMFGYISVAEKYSAGNFNAAINGFLSPLISVILSLLLYTHADAILLFKLLQVLLGLIGLILTCRLIDILKLTGGFGFFLTFFLIPIFWTFSLCYLSGDLLFLDVLLLIHVLLFNFNGIDGKQAAAIGICGGLLYLSKAYGIFFFPLLCLFSHLLIYIQGKAERKIIIRNAIISLGIFILICTAWVAVISLKYEKLTFTNAAYYNLLWSKGSMENPAANNLHIKSQLIDPTSNHLSNAWEDPSLFMEEMTIHPNLNFDEETAIFKKNVLIYYYYLFRRQIGLIFIVAIFLALLFIRKQLQSRPVLLTLFTIIVFPAGYFFLNIKANYIYIIPVLMALLTGYICFQLVKSGRKIIALLLFIPFCVLSVKRPLKQILWTNDKDKTMAEIINGVFHFRSELHHTYDIDKAVFIAKDSLLKRTDMHGSVASYCSSFGVESDSYSVTMIMNYYLKNIYYGQLTDEVILQDGKEKLIKNRIDYFYTWAGSVAMDNMVKDMPLIFEDKLLKLKIFKVKKE